MSTASEGSIEAEHQVNPYRALPQISALLNNLQVSGIAAEFLAAIMRNELDQIRQEIDAGARPSVAEVEVRCRAAVDQMTGSRFGPVINGTGIILHTNLGRAPVSDAAARAMAAAASSYLSLELDPESNRRGGRMDEIARLLRVLSGAEATLVVNNNAAAILLTLAATCGSGDVIVSRGESVEIGGGFRIPDVVVQSGCQLVEVGTTNRTYVADFERAISFNTRAMLRVHPSNFQTHGFVATPDSSELAALAAARGLLLIEDLGSGALIDTKQFGLRHEPTVREALLSGADLVTFSGDKLLGGPQAGIICGRADLVRIIEQHPLARAVRADKATLAGMAATLRHYLSGEAETIIPIWQMIGASKDELRQRAHALVAARSGVVVDSVSSIGGGSLPGETLESVAIQLNASSAVDLARRLRTGEPRVFSIVRNDAVLIDLRTVFPAQDAALAAAIARASDNSL